MTETAQTAVLITHDVGLHARPSVKLTKLAKTFPAGVQLALSGEGPWLDAKSIVKVMGLKAPHGATLHVRATGEQAEAAVAALADLVRRDFDEEGLMPEPLRLRGAPAAAGFAEGPLFDLDRPRSTHVARPTRVAEVAALDEAIGAALTALGDLMGSLDAEAADIVEFQIAMLEDDALVGPARASIAGGLPADAAWARTLDDEVAGYEASPDAYFRARAADLGDIRDRVLAALGGSPDAAKPPPGAIFGDDLVPTRFLGIDWSQGGGIALRRGSAASHVAMLARSRGVPMVVGLGEAANGAAGPALLDAERGELLIAPSHDDMAAFHTRKTAFASKQTDARAWRVGPAATAEGEPVAVRINVADPAELAGLDIAHCDGVGLMRTEFLFGGNHGLPDEEAQFAAYRAVLEWAGDKPVTIRTVDAGGDKPVAGFTVEETNPFLGLRGIRLSLSRPEVFRVQIRALLRAGAVGNLKVMLPMVSVADELERTIALFAGEEAVLKAAGIATRMPPLGIMVETPAAAIAPEIFARAAFFSIGSNDLTQYTMAAARDNGAVSALNDVRQPAVLRLIAGLAAFGRTSAIPVSLCGDAGGEPAAIPHLLRAGMRDFSVAPAQLGQAKQAIAEGHV